ncbi:MAG: hypothetical protein ACTHMP_17520, partial [Thermomicrobiales bacterium]
RGYEGVYYAANFGTKHNFLYRHWRSPLFMPRRLSRLTLQIEEVRAERLQAISENDCLSEGYGWDADAAYPNTLPRAQFRVAWDQLNAKRGFPWESNPWVWVISFRIVCPD